MVTALIMSSVGFYCDCDALGLYCLTCLVATGDTGAEDPGRDGCSPDAPLSSAAPLPVPPEGRHPPGHLHPPGHRCALTGRLGAQARDTGETDGKGVNSQRIFLLKTFETN